MILEILTYPDPRLKKVADPVTEFGAELHKFLDDMAITMYSAKGIGLAATQVNRLERVFVIDLGLQDGEPQKLYEFINPRLHDGEGKITYEEGCLSVPDLTEEVVRKEKIVVDYFDRFGKPQQLKAEGLLAVAIQHENDHLDGIVFVDRLSPLKRRFAKKRLSRTVPAL